MKVFLILIIFYLILEILSECTTFDNDEEYNCNSGYYGGWESHFWQTPPRNYNDINYKSTYQDMHYLVGYAQLQYNYNRDECEIKIITFINELGLQKKGYTDYYLEYTFGEESQINIDTIKIYKSTNKYQDGMPITVKIINRTDNYVIALLELEDEYFLWDVPEIKNQPSEFERGKKGVIVDLFGWPYEDIEEECDFLQVAGYLGVKIAPPNEYILTFDAIEDGELNPWWYVHQTISYKINNTRLGTIKQLKKMINKCRKNQIRIYAQVAINQMVDNGNDEYKEHYCDSNKGPKSGSAGSPYWTVNGRNSVNLYTNKKPIFEFPSVPYFAHHFHCKQTIKDTDWGNYDSLNYCWPSSGKQIGLNTEDDYVKQRIADFLIKLISIGLSGFSINNGKYISPENYAKIFGYFKKKLGDNDFPDELLIYLEMDIQNEKYSFLCKDTDIRSFGLYFYNKLKNNGISSISGDNADKIKLLLEFYPNVNAYCDDNSNTRVTLNRFVLSIENPNTVHFSDKNHVYIHQKNKDEHIQLYKNMLSDNIECRIRIVFSSYIMKNDANGFPDGYSDCSKAKISGCTKSIPYVKAYEPLAKGYDEWIPGNYTRIHRNLDIINTMRAWLNLDPNNYNSYDDIFEKVELLKRSSETTTLTIIPTSIISTFPSTHQNTIISTIPSTLQSAIITSIPSTLQNTFITSIPSTLQNTFITSIPSTLQSTIISTLLNKVSTKSTEISNTIFKNISTELTSIINQPYSTQLKTGTSLTIVSNENIINRECDIKCLTCNEESKKLNLCLSCDTAKGFFNDFKPCYETCLTCNIGGDKINHNCLSCDIDHRFRPDVSPPNNCVSNCSYYYISSYGEYKCIDSFPCTKEANLIIIDKMQCIDDCKKDTDYKYQYNGNCLKTCPNNTINDNYLCKDFPNNKCTLTENKNNLNITTYIEVLEAFSKIYSNEYNYTNNHISKYENNKEYKSIIYKNKSCINELSLNMPLIDFQDCYSKVQDYYTIFEDLIVVLVEKINKNNNNPTTSYSFYHPKTGKKLDSEKICSEDIILILEKFIPFIENLDNFDLMASLLQQGINIFDLSNDFYTDICIKMNISIDKDIALQDRILLFYPNVSLCDSGCENARIDFETMTTICECKFNDLKSKGAFKDNIVVEYYLGDVINFIELSNIVVLKCFKYIFKFFLKSYGSYITLFFLLINLFFSIFFFYHHLKILKIYVSQHTQNYLIYLPYQKSLDNFIKVSPPKKNTKRDKKSKTLKEKQLEKRNIKGDIDHIKINENKMNNNKKVYKSNNELNIYKKIKSSKNKFCNYNKKTISSKIINNSKENLLITLKKPKINKNISKDEFSIFINNENLINQNKKLTKFKEYFDEYLSISLEEMDYFEAIKVDRRKFCTYLGDTLKEKQNIANTFIANDPFKPRSTKIILFILNITLYFFINGLFL